MTTSDKAHSYVAHIASQFAKGDLKLAAAIGYELGRAAGREEGGQLLCHQAAELEALNGPTDETDTLRDLARRLCELADEIAVRYCPPGTPIPTEAERFKYRDWLNRPETGVEPKLGQP